VAQTAEPARILIVDDDEGLLVLMAEALRNEGHEVATAASGAAALRWLAKRTPDLMLLDLKLRDVGGQALLKRLAGKDTPVPFVVVTGQGDEKVAVEVMKEGALDYVMKDSGLLDLLPAVAERALDAVEQQRALAAEQAERRRLEGEILEIGESERRRIGGDLHDGLGQQLTAIELMCAGLKEGAADPVLARRLDQMGKMLREAVAQTRSLARGLVPVGDDADALPAGLAELADRTDSLGRVRCRFECSTPAPRCGQAVGGHLYRIAQEAVNNALKHARATHIAIRLSKEGGALRLEVADDGGGVPADGGKGLGLRVMRHRADVIGGVFEVVSRRGKGVVVRCAVPTGTP
jgi:signal transduction histidine kinase